MSLVTRHVPLSVNAKQLEQPVFQAGPNRCESDHGCQCKNPKSEGRNPKEARSAKFESAHELPLVFASGFKNSFGLRISAFGFSLLSKCNQFCTPLCEGGSSWCKST